MRDGKPISTSDGIKEYLEKEGFEELCPKEDIRFSIKENDWVFQYTQACATYWIKKA